MYNSEFKVQKFPGDIKLCPLAALKEYIKRTQLNPGMISQIYECSEVTFHLKVEQEEALIPEQAVRCVVRDS